MLKAMYFALKLAEERFDLQEVVIIAVIVSIPNPEGARSLELLIGATTAIGEYNSTRHD